MIQWWSIMGFRGTLFSDTHTHSRIAQVGDISIWSGIVGELRIGFEAGCENVGRSLSAARHFVFPTLPQLTSQGSFIRPFLTVVHPRPGCFKFYSSYHDALHRMWNRLCFRALCRGWWSARQRGAHHCGGGCAGDWVASRVNSLSPTWDDPSWQVTNDLSPKIPQKDLFRGSQLTFIPG